MKHDIIVINSKGKVGETQTLNVFKLLINNMPLVQSKYIMSQSDFDDILAWSKENSGN